MCQQQRGGGVVGVVVVYWRLISSPLFKTGCFWRSAFRDVCSLIWRRTGSSWGPARQERAEPFPGDASHQKRGRLQARSPWLKVDKGGRTGYWGSTLAWRPRSGAEGSSQVLGGERHSDPEETPASDPPASSPPRQLQPMMGTACGRKLKAAASLLLRFLLNPPPLPKRCRPGSPAALSWTLMAG